MSSLLSALGKKPYQSYTVAHGFERITVLVPIKSSREFETIFEELKKSNPTTSKILQVVSDCGGKIKGQK